MNKYILTVLIIILLFTIINKCSQNPSYNEDKQKIVQEEEFILETKEFIDKEGNYSLKYPKKWNLSDLSHENNFIRANISTNNKAGIQIRLYPAGNQSFQTFLSGYLKLFETDMLSHWGGELELQERKKIEGFHNFWRVQYSFLRKDGTRWYFIEYLWPTDNKVLVFQAGVANDFYAEGVGYLDTIAESVRFN